MQRRHSQLLRLPWKLALLAALPVTAAPTLLALNSWACRAAIGLIALLPAYLAFPESDGAIAHAGPEHGAGREERGACV